MMADERKILRRLLEEMDKEDRDDLLQELKGKKLTGAELLAAIKELDPEARAEVRTLLAEVKEEIKEENKKEKKEEKKTESKEEEDGHEKDPKRRTRPGRKSGRAYGWWIDDDGEVIKLDIARVYSGEDEPDEVDLLPKEEDEDDEDDKEEVA